MKTNRYQMKLSKCFMITDAYKKGFETCNYSIFYAVTKRTTNIDNKQKLNQNFRENAVEAVKPYFAPKRMPN